MLARSSPLREIEHLDAGHARHEPGVPVVELQESLAVAIPEPGLPRDRRERALDRSPIDLDDTVGGDLAAGGGEQRGSLTVGVECDAGLLEQGERGVDEPRGCARRQRLVGCGRAEMQAGVGGTNYCGVRAALALACRFMSHECLRWLYLLASATRKIR